MSEENKSNSTGESIEDILRSFQAQKEKREAFPDKPEVNADFSMPEPPVKTERQKTEFATIEEKTVKEEKRNKKTVKLPDFNKINELDFGKLKNFDIRKFVKNNSRIIMIVATILVIVLVVVGLIAGIAGGVEKSKTAYLKPYQEKYSSVKFPEGIQEKYCDAYGQNPDSLGYIKIDEIKLDSVVLKKADKKSTPYGEKNLANCFQNNYVVYLNDNSLEEYYADAESYNEKALGFISYSDFIYDYNFKVVGAFYTNTNPEDDNGYVFPYNVTEKLSESSSKAFIDRLETRFLYNTGVTITRQDKLITISCPTDFRRDFRFVVVGVMRDKTDDKPTATLKSKVHYPQSIYNEMGTENPYHLSAQWYPEVVIRSGSDVTKTSKQSPEEYY